jgi:hypothetical protein
MSSRSRVLNFEKYRRLNGLPEFERKHEDPTKLIAQKLGALAWAHVRGDASQVPERCWPWKGTFVAGHPVLYVNGQPLPAAAILWRLQRPESLDGYWVERAPERCDDRECANPWHHERRPKPRKEID